MGNSISMRQTQLLHAFWPNRRWLTIVLIIGLVSIGYFSTSVSAIVAQNGTGTIRVATNGSNAANCGSEAAPCRTIQYAVDHASSGTTILVAQGTYIHTSGQSECYDFGVTSAVVCIDSKDLTLLGGYSSANWTVRAPALYPTVIDGQQAYRGVLGRNTTGLYMDGFTIRNGLAQGAASGDDFAIYAYGGGMRIHNATLTLRNIILQNNKAIGGNTAQPHGGGGVGGGLAVSSNYSVNATLENITFDGNRAAGGQGAQRGGYAIGGSLHATGPVILSGKYLTFTNSVAAAGYTTGSGSEFGYDFADAQGGAASAYGGTQLNLQFVTATGNQALGGNAPNGDGGGTFGGALYFEHVQIVLSDVSTRGNLAQGGNGINATNGRGGMSEGGAIQSDDSDVTLDRVSVIANIARSGSGVVYKGSVGGGGVALTHFTENGHIQIINSIIADNRAELGTGNTLWGGGGGGLWLQGTTGSVVNSTIARNYVSDGLFGQGIILTGGDATTADISYTIIADHTNSTNIAALHVQAGAAVNLNQGLWSNNTLVTNANGYQPGTFNGLSTMKTGSANFVSPGAPNYNYHIQGSSSARDQASGSSVPIDIDGQSRALYPPADIGADEYVPIVLTVSPIASGKLLLSWQPDTLLAAGTHHYTIAYTHEAGANNPAEGVSPINVGSATSFILTGLTNNKQYTFSIQARNAANTVLETSYSVSVKPVTNFVRLPLILR